MKNNPLILPSAHREEKHGERYIADSEILHAYYQGVLVDINHDRIPPTHVLVGPSTSGMLLYEIGYTFYEWIRGDPEIIIVHAMKARKTYTNKYLSLLRNGDENETL